MKLFDSHSHLHDEKFLADREEVIENARQAGVRRILTLGDTIHASRQAIALAEATPEVIAAAGVHPSAARSWDEEIAAELEKLLAHPKVLVLGEIGLDYYWDKDEETHRLQRQAFRDQLTMARRLNLPVSIHARDANGDTLDDVEACGGTDIGGVLHCFNGSYDEARRALDLGLYIGVTGVATYPKAGDLREVLEKVGPGKLLLETDCPYLPPQPKRGRRNEPAYIAMTCELLAKFFNMPAEELAELTYENTLKAFRLDEEVI
jgi:TatD DNase family protein